MSLIQLQKYFTAFGDVFQEEAGIGIGYTRKSVEVTGTEGEVLQIGRFIGMESVSAKTGTILKTIEEIKEAKVLGIYAGNDAYQNMISENPTYNHNVTEFKADTLTQKVVVINRGQIGVARGGNEGTSRYDSGLKFPAGTSLADKEIVWAKLEDAGFKVLRQVSVQ